MLTKNQTAGYGVRGIGYEVWDGLWSTRHLIRDMHAWIWYEIWEREGLWVEGYAVLKRNLKRGLRRGLRRKLRRGLRRRLMRG
jgi:hypothetical protein